MNRRKVNEIIKFSLYKTMQNKMFVIGNFIMFLFVVIVVNQSFFSGLIEKVSDNTFCIAVLDENNLIYDEFLDAYSGDDHYEVMRVTENTYTADNISGDFAMIEIVPNEEEIFQVVLVVKDMLKDKDFDPLDKTLKEIRSKKLIEKYHIESSVVDTIDKSVFSEIKTLSVDTENASQKTIINAVATFAIYTISIFAFSRMATEIASEKQAKSTEHVLTAVTEKEYLFAKIASHIVFLIISGLLLICYYLLAISIPILLQLSSQMGNETNMTQIIADTDSNMLYYLVTVLFIDILNLILLFIIQATLASKVASVEEAGNSMRLILYGIIIAFFISDALISPYKKVQAWIYVLSCIPLFSMFFVPSMMIIGQANLIQVILAILVLLVAIPIAFNYCSKIFKNGILDYTKVSKKKKKKDMTQDFLNKREMHQFAMPIGITMIIYFGVQLILTLLGEFFITSTLRLYMDNTQINMVILIVTQLISLGLAIRFLRWYMPEEVEKKSISTPKKRQIVLVALFFIILLQVVLNYVLYPALGLDYQILDIMDIGNSSSFISKLLMIVALAVIPAVFEEIFFRETIISYSQKYGSAFAIVFSAVLFALVHANLSQGLFAFIMGLILGGIYLYTGDIHLTMLIHLLNNGFAVLQLILPEIGNHILLGVAGVVFLFGLLIVIKILMKSENRTKLKNICCLKIDKTFVQEKLPFIFSDYVFVVSLMVMLVLAFINESFLRGMS